MSLDFGQDSTTNPNDAGGENWSSGSTSSSSSSSSWRDPQFVWGGQSPFLEGLYQRGAGMMDGNPLVQQGIGSARGLYNQGRTGINAMMNPRLNPQMRAYGDAVGRNFERNILPGIRDQSRGFGQYGGSRGEVAEGIAAGEARQQMQDFGAQLYNQDRDRMMQAAALAPTMGAFGMGIPWHGIQQYAGLLGRPTVLGGAAGSESSSSSHGSESSYGYNYNVGGGTGEQGWDFGFGLKPGNPGAV